MHGVPMTRPLLLAACLLAATGCAPAAGASASAASTSARPPGPALVALDQLPVGPAASAAGYDREAFGPAWADVDRNGCDTRNDVLRRDLTDVEVRPGTHGCVVVAGRLADPYTGRELVFAKATAGEVQVNHVVALADAWRTGADAWTPTQRRAYANDPLGLLAVDGRTNSAKGDADAAAWLPPDPAYACPYVARQVAVKRAYALRVTARERDAMTRVLRGCPEEPLPVSGR